MFWDYNIRVVIIIMNWGSNNLSLHTFLRSIILLLRSKRMMPLISLKRINESFSSSNKCSSIVCLSIKHISSKLQRRRGFDVRVLLFAWHFMHLAFHKGESWLVSFKCRG